MGKSETEVLLDMYATATEIQEQWNPTLGDIFQVVDVRDRGNPCTYFVGNSALPTYEHNPETKVLEKSKWPFSLKHLRIFNNPPEMQKVERIWIPSQEQLQVMLDLSEYQILLLKEENLYIAKINFTNKEACCYEMVNGLTMDILWLKIVMLLKYKKIWKEDVWQKEER